MIQHLRACLLITAFLAALSCPATAQESPPPDHRLDPNPLHAEALGLTMRPPAAARTEVQRIGEHVSITLIDPGEVPAWSMRIQRYLSKLEDSSSEKEITAQLNLWTSAQRRFRILTSEDVSYAGRDGHLCWIVQEGGDTEPVAHGWMFLSRGGQEHLAFTMQALPEQLPRVRPMLEASFSTIELLSVDELVEQRRERVDAGLAFLESLTRQDLESLVGREQWFRYYVPGEGSAARDEELGSLYVSFREDMRGEVNPQRREGRFGPAERETGLMVVVRGRYLEAAPGVTYDSEALYWISWDLAEETWSIRGTRRYGKKEQSEAVTGLRMPKTTGDPHGRIVVVSSGKSGSGRDQRSWRVPEVYLPQALRWALGYLLPRDETTDETFSYYCVDTSGPEMSFSLRVDEWKELQDGTRRWKLQSKTRSDAPIVTSLFDADGNLLRRDWPDGSVTEPIALQDLRQLWESKGLNTDQVR